VAQDAERSHVDVIIVGAGLSGIGAAWHLQARNPSHSYLVLEGREAMGGTWDLFRYPGIRSDSDMYTLGYAFRPWPGAKDIADGPAIKAYVEDTAREYGIDRHVRFGHRVVRAEWSSDDATWTVHCEVGDGRAPATYTCRFLLACTGYYRYDRGFTPHWPGMETFAGRFVHPQHWPADLDHAGKRVVVVGSGATAVTLVPSMAEGAQAAASVTMLQRSPTYIAIRPSRDPISHALRTVLPGRLAHGAARWFNIARGGFYYWLARVAPGVVRATLTKEVAAALGDAHAVDPHFVPRYDPWDQRLCLAPDGDFFRAIRTGKAHVVTDTIEAFTPTGIRLASGRQLEADIVVTATGLELQLLHGIALAVDGVPVELPRTLVFKGALLSDVPNFVAAVGYTNMSWTLKCDLIAEHASRLIRHMADRGYVQVTPRRPRDGMAERPVLDLTSGYVQRALGGLPRQGDRAPWRLEQNYLKDLARFRFARVDDPALEFRRADERARVTPSASPALQPA
jgi:cation diffusion facilitator CzcD-associated flavoprotein CzcO